MHIIKKILIFIFILLLLFLGLYTGSFGHQYKFVYNFLLSFIITIIFLKKNKKEFLIVYVIISVALTYMLFHINDFKIIALHTLSSLSLLLGIIFGLMYYYLRFKYFTLIIALFINSFIFLYGYEIWLNKLNFGTFLGSVNYELKNNTLLYDVNNNIFTFEKDKIYVLDFWTTTCGVCFIKFPKFESLRNKFQNDSVIFYAVNNMHRDESIESNSKFLVEHHVSIPSLYFKGNKTELAEIYKVNLFPTVIVIQDGKIIFKGSNASIGYFLNTLK